MTAVEYRTESVGRFLEGLSAGTSTPGGGAVAAIAADIAVPQRKSKITAIETSRATP